MTAQPRFLIDENLSVQLPQIAHQRGYECVHVRDLGLLSEKDWDLLRRIKDEDWTLVTNNAEEFRTRYRRSIDLHAGVIFLIDVWGTEAQRHAFAAALDDIDHDADLTNTEMLVDSYGRGYRVRRFELP